MIVRDIYLFSGNNQPLALILARSDPTGAPGAKGIDHFPFLRQQPLSSTRKTLYRLRLKHFPIGKQTRTTPGV
jgi:hypothetical protein